MAFTIENTTGVTHKILYKGSADFYRILRARVDDHFAGRNRRDDPRLYLKSAIVLS